MNSEKIKNYKELFVHWLAGYEIILSLQPIDIDS